MVYVLVRHKVKDYSKWKPVFDQQSENRKGAGVKGVRLFHNIDSINDISIILEWDTIENAKKFYDSDDLKKIMKEAGVVRKPYIYFLEEFETVQEEKKEFETIQKEKKESENVLVEDIN